MPISHPLTDFGMRWYGIKWARLYLSWFRTRGSASTKRLHDDLKPVKSCQLSTTQLYEKSHLKSKVCVYLYSAFYRKVPQMRSDMDHTVLPVNYTMPAFTPQPQNITALWLVLILPSHGG